MTGIKNRCSPSPRSRTQILELSRYASFVKCIMMLSVWFLNNSLEKGNYFTKQKNCKALNISTSFYMHSMTLFSCRLKKKLFGLTVIYTCSYLLTSFYLWRNVQRFQMVDNCPVILLRYKVEIMLFSPTSDLLKTLTVPPNFGHYQEYR